MQVQNCTNKSPASLDGMSYKGDWSVTKWQSYDSHNRREGGGGNHAAFPGFLSTCLLLVNTDDHGTADIKGRCKISPPRIYTHAPIASIEIAHHNSNYSFPPSQLHNG